MTVGVWVGVAVSVGVSDAVTVKYGVIVGDGVNVHVGVLLAVAVELAVAVRLGSGVSLGGGVMLGVGVIVGVEVGGGNNTGDQIPRVANSVIIPNMMIPPIMPPILSELRRRKAFRPFSARIISERRPKTRNGSSCSAEIHASASPM